METLPTKLNFFKSAEQFLELRRLDRHYKKQMEIYDKNEALRHHTGVNLNLPTWNLEKKILNWTYLRHKHLGSDIDTKLLLDKEFLEDIRSTKTEIKFCSAKETIKNLIAHGFAVKSDVEGAIWNQEWLSAGLLIANLYYTKKAGYKNSEPEVSFEFFELVPYCFKNTAYYFIYITAWLLILESISLIALELLRIDGLMDDLKIFFINIGIPIWIFAKNPKNFYNLTCYLHLVGVNGSW